ncbi:MAG: hypothetical protein JW863_20550, partial [Chitinispirillaceae bacterium]|nr:hypothetical protein [Chitinispirillaceae bacterium]
MKTSFLPGITALFAVILSIVLAPSRSAAFVTIIENTPERFTFSWEMDPLDTTSYPDGNGGRLVSLGFSGSDIALGEYGEAVVPGVAITVGVPLTGNITATVSPSEVRTLRLAYPVETWREKNAEGRMDGTTFSGRWLSSPDYSMYRRQRVARLLFRPVVYDQASRSVTLLARGTVTVTFPVSGYRKVAVDPENDYEAMLRYLMMNYEVAKGFRSPTGLTKRSSAPDYPLRPSVKAYTFKVGDGHDGLNEAMTDENGIMKLSGKRIRELFGNVATGNVHLYAACKGMLPDTLPADGTIADGIVEISMLRIDRNQNDTVDEDDFFLAYVTGASDWEYDLLDSQYEFKLDFYDDYRNYWLTATSGNGRSAGAFPAISATPDTTLITYMDYQQYRQSKGRRAGNLGDRRWLWRTLSSRSSTFEQVLSLPGLVEGDSGWIELHGESGGNTLNVSLGDRELCEDCVFYGGYPVNVWDSDTLRFEYLDDVNSNTGSVDLEYFNLHYPRELFIGDDPVQLRIPPPQDDSMAVARYRLAVGTSQKVYVLRTSSDGSETVLIDTLKFAKAGEYEWADSIHNGYQYVLCNESGLLAFPDVEQPASATGSYTSVKRDLRSTAYTADFLIIAPTEFLPAADSLARHKARAGFSHPVVVDVNDVYRYFSGGDKDVAAIRNFIGYVTRYWKNGDALDYVLLMGLGHYDTKNYQTTVTDFIPVYIHGSECMEDFYTCVVPAPAWETPKPQMALGRLPCGTLEQAWNIVKKIVQMEDPAVADMSEWRNRALFVADDDMQGSSTDQVALSTPHHLSSDRTATVIDTLWPSIDIRKVYLYEYEWDEAWQKPGASRALINEINNGVGYVNFFGHGADITWTDEYILTPDMVTGMSNTKRYPVISAFSCSVGKFDLPGKECLSGILARAAGVGSIASISSTREAYASANENLAKNFYRFLFDSTASNSIGMAMIAAYRVITGEGYRTYALLGDPSVRAVRPTHEIALAIDGSSKPDTLSAMQKVVISGRINKNNGSTDAAFGGNGAYVAIGFFNAPDTATRKDGKEELEKKVKYVLPGTPVFMGKVPVSSGRFSQTVLLPQNLSFDKPGVKLTAYAWKDHDTLAAVGSLRDIVFHGSTSLDSINDVNGPRISVRPAYDTDRLSGGNASFGDHVTVQMPVTCEVELFDESGIDASGIGPDEGVTLEIEGVYARQNVNNKFQFQEGDYRRGVISVVYEEDALKPGTYTMVVTARDLVGNLSKSRFTLEVTDWDE